MFRKVSVITILALAGAFVYIYPVKSAIAVLAFFALIAAACLIYAAMEGAVDLVERIKERKYD